MDKKWNERTTLEKVVLIISWIALGVWVLFEMLERTTSLQVAKVVNNIAICIICVCEAFTFWKVKRAISYVAIGGAICIVAVAVLEILWAG